MPAREHAFTDYFYGTDELDRVYPDVLGELGAIKLGLKPKRPDKARLGKLLDQASKPPSRAKGEFYLALDGTLLSFGVRIASTRTVLATLDLAKVKDPVKRRDLMYQLSARTALVGAKDLAAFDAANADPEDSAAAIEINRKIDALKDLIDTSRILLGSNYRKRAYDEHDREFGDWARKKGFGAYLAFADDVRHTGYPGPEARKLLEDRRAPVPRAATRQAIDAALGRGETPDYAPARREVVAVIDAHLLPRFNKERIAEHRQRIETAAKEIAALNRRLKALQRD